MNWDRWTFDAFFDYSNWMVGFAFDSLTPAERLFALSLGPLVIVAAYRV